MSELENGLGQPIGPPVEAWRERPSPPRTVIIGRFARVEPIDVGRHAADLHAANMEDHDGRIWTYMGYGPFATLEAYETWLRTACLGADPMFHAIVDQGTGRAAGLASYLRIEPKVGAIEVGHINLAPSLQRTRAASEAMFLLMRRVFDELGYRRCEWKSDALNAPSRSAAIRLGFTYEGTFRQATIYKGRNRDTAWFAIIDKDWPALKAAYERWLDPANFDAAGRQRQRLGSLTAEALAKSGTLERLT